MDNRIGNCRICGKYEKLSFEHVPPSSSFNKKTRYKTVPYLELIQAKNPFNYNPRSKTEQGGIGFYSLCNNCNNFLGTNYVNAYNTYSKAITHLNYQENNHFIFQINQIEPLKVIKQIVSMFLSINNWTFSQNHCELAQFIKDLKSNNLPDKYRLFSYITIEGQPRNFSFMVKGTFYPSALISFSEISFPPLGHVLSINYDGSLLHDLHLTEITHFKDYGISDNVSVELDMYKLPTISPLPLDYSKPSE